MGFILVKTAGKPAVLLGSFSRAPRHILADVERTLGGNVLLGEQKVSAWPDGVTAVSERVAQETLEALGTS